MIQPIIFMFSGQGSQYYQMGRELFAVNKTFQNWMLKADDICQDMTNISIVERLYDTQNPKNLSFSSTILSHPAIFMFEYALTQVLIENDIYPDLVLGASMGEFAAAAVADILSFEDALIAVITQAKALEQTSSGGMLAIFHDYHDYQKESYLHQNSELAAINFSKHFVVSGSDDHLNYIISELNQRDTTSQMLPVTHAFHSSLIDSAKKPFLEAIQHLELSAGRIPLISCVTKQMVTHFTPHHFWDTARSPILFKQTIEHLENKSPIIYVDLGPSGTLATFVKYNLAQHSKSQPITLISPFTNDNSNLDKALIFLRMHVSRKNALI